MIQGCDLLVGSVDHFLEEAEVTLGRLRSLGFLDLMPAYLLLGDKEPNLEGVRVIHRRRPGTWSSELREGLLQLDKPYVLFWLDDFVPLRTAPLDEIVGLIRAFMAAGGNYLRLNRTPAGHGPRAFAGAREILPGEVYRTSTIFSVWRRETLLGLIRDEESAWQFELVGSRRSDGVGGFYASENDLIEHVNLVVKGLVDPRAERVLLKHGVGLRNIARRRMVYWELALLRLKEFRSRIFELLPWGIRRSIRDRFSTNLRPAS